MTRKTAIDLHGLFADEQPDCASDEFVESVSALIRVAQRRRWLRRFGLALSFALLGWQFQGLAVDLSRVLLVQLVELEPGLAFEILAPINSIGALLSSLLLLVRGFHRRLLAG